MNNQIIPELCGNKIVPYMTYNDCGYGIYTLLFEDGTFVINLPEEKLVEYGMIHGSVVKSFDPFINPYDYIFVEPEDRPWNDYVEDVTRIEVASEIQPKDMSYWFCGMNNALTADVSLIDTSQTRYMIYTFASCSSLEHIDLSTFNTEELISPYLMFLDCGGTDVVDLSNWTFNDNTKLAWRMVYFGTAYTIRNVTRFITSNVDTSNVTDMSYMFSDLKNVSELDLSSFDTSNVTDMSGMFESFGRNASGSSLDCSSFDTSNVVSMSIMFAYCKSLRSLDVSSFDTSNVVEMYGMFYDIGLIELYICSFTRENLEYGDGLFSYATNLTTIYTTSAFNLTDIEYGNYMFMECRNLVGGSGTVYDGNYVGKERAKIDGGVGNEGYFTAC